MTATRWELATKEQTGHEEEFGGDLKREARRAEKTKRRGRR